MYVMCACMQCALFGSTVTCACMYISHGVLYLEARACTVSVVATSAWDVCNPKACNKRPMGTMHSVAQAAVGGWSNHTSACPRWCWCSRLRSASNGRGAC